MIETPEDHPVGNDKPIFMGGTNYTGFGRSAKMNREGAPYKAGVEYILDSVERNEYCHVYIEGREFRFGCTIEGPKENAIAFLKATAKHNGIELTEIGIS